MSFEIPAYVLYSLPAVPLFAYGWYTQFAADRRVRELTGTDEKIKADAALADFLKASELEDVEVVKSENYMQNEYDESVNKIFLSPDSLGHSDASSIALALRAGAQAATYRRSPQKTALAKSLHRAETTAFWSAFTVLAFGIMASHLFMTLIGYALCFVVFAVFGWRAKLLREVDSFALDFAEKNFEKKTFENVKKVLDAERRKF